MSRKTEIQVGITVLVAIAILLWGIAWLSTYAKAHVQRVWHVRFEQAGGLAEGNEAHVNGVRKGSVKALRLQGDHVIVDLALSKDIVLTHDSHVVIRSVSMMGDKVIAVDLRDTGAPWTARDTISGEYEKGLPEIMADVGKATGSIEAIAAQLEGLANAMNRRGGLTATAENFRQTSEDLRLAVAENRKAVKQSMDDLAAITAAGKGLVADHKGQLDASLDHFASAAKNLDRISGRLDSLRSSIQTLADKLNRGDGTLGRLVNDQKLYAELDASVRDLRALINDIKAQPRKYFRFTVF